MRTYLLLGATSFALAACGGGAGAGPEAVGSVAPPTINGDVHSFVKPTTPKLYNAVGGVQHYQYETRSDRSGQTQQLYAADANTVRDGGITVNYNPRDAIFEVQINRANAVSNNAARFQDPNHRTAFGGNSEPQVGVPPTAAEKGIQYLEAGSATGDYVAPANAYPVGGPGFKMSVNTFFYQKPGTTTSYVTYGGYVRNDINTVRVTETVYDAAGQPLVDANGKTVTREYLKNAYALDRAVFAWGEQTDSGAVPRTGSATYSGDLLATMVYNDQLDIDRTTPSYFQWITGTNTTVVDFTALTVKTTLNGTVNAPALDAYTSGAYTIAAGSVSRAPASINRRTISSWPSITA